MPTLPILPRQDLSASSFTLDPSALKIEPMPEDIRIRNRRKRYLEANPSYFGSSLETADPLLYDRLIRSHQTASERTSERQTKGYALTLEADLLRAEAKLAEVKSRRSEADATATTTSSNRGMGPSPQPVNKSNGNHAGNDNVNSSDSDGDSNSDPTGHINQANGTSSQPLSSTTTADTDTDSSLTRTEAYDTWHDTMKARFLAGDDPDFDYAAVDQDEKWDDMRGEERDLEDEWFDQEEATFVGSEDENGEQEGIEGEDGSDGKVRKPEGKGRKLEGETGVQDF